MIPRCPPQLPNELREPLLAFGLAWVRSPNRPRARPDVARRWDALLDEWTCAPSVPLFVRKGAARGTGQRTHSSGRTLVPCDNSPAVWAFTLAMEGTCPTIADVTALAAGGGIPTEFTRLGRFDEFYAAGWKLAHVKAVGLGTRTPIEQLPLVTLQEHLRLLLSPSNHFAVPKVWAGLGEIPEIIGVVGDTDARERENASHVDGNTPVTIAPTLPPARPPSTPATTRRAAALPANTYTATRLYFRANVIQRLEAQERFRVETPEGAFEMTRAEFERTFDNVVASNSYRLQGAYSYATTPEKAFRYLVRS